MSNEQVQEVVDAQSVDMQPRAPNVPEQPRELNRRRDTYATIAELPDDVLLAIFALTQTIYPESKWYREVTHVCRRWRDIAIEAAALWTNPPLQQHDFAMLTLARSKSADLSIHINSNNLPDETLNRVLGYLSRVEKLEISTQINMLDISRKLMASSGQQASRLKRLILHCYSREPWDCRPMLTLPAFCQLRALRELDVTNVIFDWSVLPLPNLVHLKFRNTSCQGLVSIRKLVDIMRQMPHLESLQFPLSQISLSTTETLSMTQVMLPRLNSLNLLDSTTVVTPRILSNIKLPRLRRMVIEPHPSALYHPDIGDPSQTIHEVVSSVTGGDFGTFDSLSIFGACFQLNMFDQRDMAHVHFQMGGNSNSRARFHQIFVDILLPCRAQLSQLVEVQLLGHELKVSLDALFSLSTVLGSVRRMIIHNGEEIALSLIRVLELSPPNYPSKADSGFVPFSSLDSIEFHQIFFSPSTLDALRNALMLRLQYNVPTPKLDFHYCSSVSSHLTSLEEIVGQGNLCVREYQK